MIKKLINKMEEGMDEKKKGHFEGSLTGVFVTVGVLLFAYILSTI